MRFYIFDPCLYGAGGHSLDYALEVARIVDSQDIPLTIVAHRDFYVTALSLKEEFVPHFSMGHKDVDSFFIRLLASLSHRLGKILGRGAWFLTQRDIPARSRAKIFIKELKSFLDEKSISSADVCLFPNASFFDAIEIASFARQLGKSCPKIHVILRFDPPLSCDYYRGLWRKYLDNFPFKIWCDTIELKEVYQDIIGVEILLIKMPFPRASVEDRREGPSLVYLGEARLDKGFDQIPKILSILIENEIKMSVKIQILTQKMTDKRILKAADEIFILKKNNPNYNIEIIFGPMNSNEYENWLNSATLILCLYENKDYKFRSAGVVTQAVERGTMVMMRYGDCSPINMIYRNHCEDLLLVTDLTEESIINCLQLASKNLDVIPRVLDCTEAWGAPWEGLR